MALSIIYTNKQNARDSILPDSIIEAQLFLSDRRIRRQHMGSSVPEWIMYGASKNDIPDEFSVEQVWRGQSL